MRALLTVLTILSLCLNNGVIREEMAQNDARVLAWQSMTDEQRAEANIEYKAAITGYTVEEFELLSRCIESESNRQFDEEGYRCRLYIALTIINRVNSSSFPNNVIDVIQQPGQFSVYASGAIYTVEPTKLSDLAIIEARQMIAEGNAPNILYFNCVGYNYSGVCTPYAYVGGNYFMTIEEG